MVQRRHFMSAVCIYLTLFSGIARAYADSTDPYPSREILLKAAISICTEVNSQNPVSSLKVSPLIQKLLLKTPDSKNTVYDGTGWTIDTFFHEPPATFLRLLKSNSYFIFDYRQSPQTIESIANITLEKDCQFSGARFTYYNSALRPVRRIKLDSSYQEIQSVVIEEPVKEISPVSPTPKDRVRIGIIDTGIDYNHSSLIEKSRPMLGIDLITKDRPPYDYTNTIQNEEMGKHFSHGTAVADIASRNVDALIIPVRTSNQPNLDGAAVEYLAKKGVHIINISQGTSNKTEWLPLKAAMKRHPEILFIV
ncbi:MAG: S8 family serine peptidase, partial [Pseudobdellovibrionaceae bacterium]